MKLFKQILVGISTVVLSTGCEMAVQISERQAAETAAAGTPNSFLPNGQWSGRGLTMNVSDSGANLEFDCAGGRVDGRIPLNKERGFQVYGIYSSYPGGAIPVDWVPTELRARYTGSLISDHTLLLNMELMGPPVTKPLGPIGEDPIASPPPGWQYLLELNGTSKLLRCL